MKFGCFLLLTFGHLKVSENALDKNDRHHQSISDLFSVYFIYFTNLMPSLDALILVNFGYNYIEF